MNNGNYSAAVGLESALGLSGEQCIEGLRWRTGSSSAAAEMLLILPMMYFLRNRYSSGQEITCIL
jgi:hypothetical protein